MTVDSASIDAVMARISQIQSQFALLASNRAAGASAATSTTGASPGAPSGAGTDFAQALAGATGTGSVAPDASAPSSGGVSGADVVASAKKYLGVPYVFGGTTSAGLDCSGLVQRAYRDLGITLPRLSWDQAKAGQPVSDLAHAQPGDILGFGSPAEHVAIYLGHNMMIAAPQPGENVKIQSVYETPASIRRIVGPDAEPALAQSSASGVSGASGSAALAGYATIFQRNEASYGLPAGLLAAVAQTESGGDASAVSPAGAQGLMQLMPTTAAGLGVNPWDPAQAVRGASELLSGYLHKYNSLPLALAAYNAGPGAVDQYGGVPPFAETQNYVRKITALMGAPA